MKNPLKGSDIYPTNGDIRHIFYSHYTHNINTAKQVTHWQCQAQLIMHHFPEMDKKTQERARQTLITIETLSKGCPEPRKRRYK